MQQQGPKRRTTQMGIGQSGTRPRASEPPPPSSKGVLCPPPSTPPRRPPSAEHGTVEFSENATTNLRESVRERAASATNEIEARGREEAKRRDSVRERLAARLTPPERIDMRDVAARAETIPAPRATDSTHRRAEKETIRRATTWELDDPPPASTRGVPTPREEKPAARSAPVQAKPPQGRTALRVDDVGTAAVRLAARAPQDARPRVLVNRRALASAPIDHREAFLVSLIDGSITVAGLVDVSGMREGEVTAALQRLARLGIISL